MGIRQYARAIGRMIQSFGNTMTGYIIRRLIGVVLVLMVVCYITFWLIHAAPGNFLDVTRLQGFIAGDQVTQQQIMGQWEDRFGSNKPVNVQYVRFIKDTVTFNFGPSFRYPNRTIETMIREGFPVSFSLALLSVAVAFLIGAPLGILAALRRNTWMDRTCVTLAMGGQCIPPYVIALGLQLLLSVYLGWLPTSGWGHGRNFIMPVLALAIAPIAIIVRYMRTSMITTLNESYIRTAWAKGGSPMAVIGNHALRNSLIPLITVMGPQVGTMLVGTVWIETIYRVPGLGRYFATAATDRDYPLMIASLMFLAATISIMNLLVDISYRIIDPRLRNEGG